MTPEIGNPLAPVLPDAIRDRVIEHLTDDEADLYAYIGELQADVRVQREMVSVLLAHSNRLQHANEGLLRALHAIRRDERRDRMAA